MQRRTSRETAKRRARHMASSAALREAQRDLENHANTLSKLQKDIAKNHQVRKQYTIQLGENELVLKELELLNEDANVYKLIGPVLVKQDLAEANANVKKRIEYISAELKRLDGTLQDLEEKQNSKKDTSADNDLGLSHLFNIPIAYITSFMSSSSWDLSSFLPFSSMYRLFDVVLFSLSVHSSLPPFVCLFKNKQEEKEIVDDGCSLCHLDK
ncbi:hypothetical protein ACLOJK_010865 [Asimina triloba]